MPRSMTADALASIMQESVDEVWVQCIEITHDDLPAPIRIVNYATDITKGGNVYTATAFQTQLPDDDAENFAGVTLVIDNVNQSLTESIRSVEGEPEVTLSLVLVGSPNTDEVGPFFFLWKTTDITLETVRATLAHEDTRSEPVPWQRFTPRNFPGLFA